MSDERIIESPPEWPWPRLYVRRQPHATFSERFRESDVEYVRADLVEDVQRRQEDAEREAAALRQVVDAISDMTCNVVPGSTLPWRIRKLILEAPPT